MSTASIPWGVGSADAPLRETELALVACLEANIVITVRDEDVSFDLSPEGKAEFALLLERHARDLGRTTPTK